MRILGIETSCDETGAAVIEGEPGDTKVELLSNIVASSLTLHAKTGGIIPEVAAREQIKYIIPVIEKALKDSGSSPSTIDAIAVTFGPGLIGSLLVGVETAKTLAYVWEKPIIPVNHLIGHIYANFIGRTEDGIRKTDNGKTEYTESLSSVTSVIRLQSSIFSPPNFPALALIVSGGHTDLVLMKNHKQLRWIGGTRDDAVGEAFDKIGRLLGLPYPGGPAIARAAEKGNPKAFNFPRPMIDSDDFDFSFSGLKTAVLKEVKNQKSEVRSPQLVVDLSASVQQAIVDVLVAKTLKAGRKFKVKSILLGGGVATNDLLRQKLEVSSHPSTSFDVTQDKSLRTGELGVTFFAPAKNLCTDNGAMIAAAALFHYKPLSWQQITADPGLHF